MVESTKSTAIKKRSKTDLNKENFIALFFKHTGNISYICKTIGIHRTTYYLWLKKDKKFKETIDAELEGLIDFVESKLFNLIDDKNVAAVIFFLKTKGKGRGYVERIEQLFQGDEFKPLRVTVTSDGNKSDNPT